MPSFRTLFTVDNCPEIKLDWSRGDVVLLVSDVHLHPRYPKRSQVLRETVEHHQDRLAAFISLGDLFEFWFGYRTVVHHAYLETLALLERLKDADVPQYFFLGNHDVNYGSWFTDHLRATVCGRPHQLTINGRRIVMGHGDELDRSIGYVALYHLMRHRLVQGGFQSLHPDIGWQIADVLSLRKTPKQKSMKKSVPNVGMYKDTAWRWLVEQGVNAFIHGHFHFPEQRDFRWEGRKLDVLSMGDGIYWMTFALLYPDGRIELRVWDSDACTSRLFEPTFSVRPAVA